MSKKKGSTFGGSLLICGSCVGAGMLGLPIQTGLGGFFPSISAFLLVWFFMLSSGLILLEVNSKFSLKANLLSMTSKILGRFGKSLCWIFYLFLFYAILVAYMAASGNILSHFLDTHFLIQVTPVTATLFFVAAIGILTFFGTKTVDLANRFLMFFKILFFVLVVVLCLKFLNPNFLQYSQTLYMAKSVPILITAFGFHNMIPTLLSYSGGDKNKVRLSILYGSLLSLAIYLIWQFLVLGIIPLDGTISISSALKSGIEASQLLSEYLGKSLVGILVQGLGFFAILTSFLTQSHTLSDFLTDGLKLNESKKHQVLALILTLIPPLILAILNPDVFYKALNFAGGICTVILFGILPSLMLWKIQKQDAAIKKLINNRLFLALMLVFASSIFLFEFIQLINNF